LGEKKSAADPGIRGVGYFELSTVSGSRPVDAAFPVLDLQKQNEADNQAKDEQQRQRHGIPSIAWQ